jgi:hypothetical protein
MSDTAPVMPGFAKPLPWYRKAWVHIMAALTTVGLLAFLLWRAIRHRESVNAGLEDFVSRSKLQTEALRTVLAESALAQARHQRELDSIKLESDTKVHLESIEDMDAKHVAEEWNRRTT